MPGTGGSAAVISPHLDDAVLSAWSVLAGPANATVVTVCAGVPPDGPVAVWDAVTGAVDSSRRMAERIEEDGEALGLAGCAALHLGFLDDQYRHSPLDQAELVAALRPALADAGELWAPAGIGGHPDHLQARDAALAIADEDGRPLRLYAELPYAIKLGWPAWVSGRDGHPNLVPDARWSEYLPQGRVLDRRRHQLAPGEAERKLRALAAYRTQFHGLDAGPVGLLSNPEVIGYEVSWSVG